MGMHDLANFKDRTKTKFRSRPPDEFASFNAARQVLLWKLVQQIPSQLVKAEPSQCGDFPDTPKCKSSPKSKITNSKIQRNEIRETKQS